MATLKEHKIKALKHARELIESEKEEYICNALEDYSYWISNSTKALDAVYYLKQYCPEFEC